MTFHSLGRYLQHLSILHSISIVRNFCNHKAQNNLHIELYTSSVKIMQWKCGEPTQVGQLGNDKNIISRYNLLKMKSLSRSEFLIAERTNCNPREQVV